MKQRILLTRPRASSERWAKILALRGFDCVIEPLLAIEPTYAPRPAGNFQAVLLTSANAPDALELFKEQIQDLFGLPCFCVGASTAGAARAVGFSNIICGASDSGAMARTVVDHIADKTSPLLHIAGDVVDGKARAILDQHKLTLTSWAVYRAVAAADLSPELRDALARGEIAAMPVFSPRSGRVLVSLIDKNRLGSTCAQIRAVALSQAVADVLQNLPWRSLCVATSPSEEEILASLQNELSEPDGVMTVKENPDSVLPPPKKEKSGFVWGLLVLLLLLVGMMVLAAYQRSRARGDESEAARVVEVQPVAVENAPQTREAPPVADIAALNEKIVALEARMAEVQNKQGGADARRLVASLAAFEDMREAARQGRNFAAALARLRAAGKDDALILEQTALLEKNAANSVPDMAQLRGDLANRESHGAAPEAVDGDVSLTGRLKKILRPLISVRPAHNPQFVDLENALDRGDAAAALGAYTHLPEDAQKALGDFGPSLQARVEIDEALDAIDAHFTHLGDAP